MPIIQEMEADKSWIEHFNVQEKDLNQWQKQMPKGQSLLQYALEAAKIEQNAYLDWATAHFQLPQIKDQFFMQPLDFELWQKAKDWHAWRGDLFPISEWNGILYIACYTPDPHLKLPQPHVFVLGSVGGLKMGWDQIQSMKSILSHSPEIAPTPAPELEPTPEVPSEISAPEGLSIQLDPTLSAPANPENILQFDPPPPPPEDEGAIEGPEGINLQVEDFSFNFEMPSGLSDALETSSQSAEPSADAPLGLSVSLKPSEANESTDRPLDLSGGSVPDFNFEAENLIASEEPSAPDAVASVAQPSEPPPSPPPPPQATYEASNEEEIKVAAPAPSTPPAPEKAPAPSASTPTPSPGKVWPIEEVAKSLSQNAGVAPLSRSTDFERLQVKRTEPFHCRSVQPSEIESARSELGQCQTTEEIAATCFRQMSKYFDQNLFFVFRQEHLIPWRWSGNWSIDENTKPEPIALVEPSLFRIAYQSNLPYHGYCVPSSVNDAFFALWRHGELPAHATLIPVRMDGKLIAMVLGLAKEKKADTEYRYSLRLMEDLADRISQAYKRIQLRKAS